MNDFDKNALKNFILEASKATYASGDESIKEKQPDGSTTIEYKSGAYKYHDNKFDRSHPTTQNGKISSCR